VKIAARLALVHTTRVPCQELLTFWFIAVAAWPQPSTFDALRRISSRTPIDSDNYKLLKSFGSHPSQLAILNENAQACAFRHESLSDLGYVTTSTRSFEDAELTINTGDLSHLVSILILLHKMHQTNVRPSPSIPPSSSDTPGQKSSELIHHSPAPAYPSNPKPST
jgi:hypothetical protein